MAASTQACSAPMVYPGFDRPSLPREQGNLKYLCPTDPAGSPRLMPGVDAGRVLGCGVTRCLSIWAAVQMGSTTFWYEDRHVKS